MRGRKPLSTATKALEGNPGKRHLNDAEPQPPAPEPSTFNRPPPELEGNIQATEEWSRLAPMLVKCRQITEADRSVLVALCLEWSRYLAATRELATLGLVIKAPSGYLIPNPYLSIATRALAGCNRLWVELGLTPSSRSRVRAEGPPPGGDAFSEFDQPPEVTKH